MAVIADPAPTRTAIDDPHQPFAVDGGGKCAADAHVVEGRSGVLRQDDHCLVAGGRRHQIRLCLTFHLADQARVDVQHRVELTRAVARECGLGLAFAVDHFQPVQVGKALAPVIIEALEGHASLRVAAGDAERPGADALHADALKIRVRRHHDAIIFSEHEGEFGVPGIQVEADCGGVNHLSALDLLRGKVAPTVQFEG